MDAPTCSSPWIASNAPSKWFVVSVLEAWYHSGAFKPHLTGALYETLKNYYETISTGTETTLEVWCNRTLRGVLLNYRSRAVAREFLKTSFNGKPF